jgi:hemolysin activation/secretion protein
MSKRARLQFAFLCLPTKNVRVFVFFLQLVTIALLSFAGLRPATAQGEPQLPQGESELEQIPPPQTPQPAPTPLPPQEEILKPNESTPAPEEELPETLSGKITVTRFEFVGSTVFTPAELAAVTKSYLNRPISFSELLQARAAVTKLYTDNGYVTSGAYIPPQTIENGVVKIEIVEGSIETINVDIQGRLTADYVRDRIALATDKPLNVDRLLEALQLLQVNPLIAKISAELSAGTRPGTSILDVNIEAANTFSAQALLDNGRVPAVGSLRRGVEFSEASLLKLGDTIRGAYRNTDGSDDFDLDYTLPINARNGTIKAAYRKVYSEIISPSKFKILYLDSEYERYALEYRQPIVQTANQEFALGVAFDHQNSQSVLGLTEEPVVVPGTENDGKTRVSSLRLFQEWTQRNEEQVFAARSEFSFGLDAFSSTNSFDAAINPQAPETRYFAWRGQTQWVQLLAPDTLLVARSDLQFSDAHLVSLEQFSLGGLGSVEGYRQNQVLTDNGIFAGLEVRLPIIDSSDIEGTLVQVIPFVNFGTGWNNAGVANPDPTTLASVGLGLLWQQDDFFNARIDWGIPLIDDNVDEGNTWQDDGIHFSIIFKPF